MLPKNYFAHQTNYNNLPEETFYHTLQIWTDQSLLNLRPQPHRSKFLWLLTFDQLTFSLTTRNKPCEIIWNDIPNKKWFPKGC